jgi:hypothetical protein
MCVENLVRVVNVCMRGIVRSVRLSSFFSSLSPSLSLCVPLSLLLVSKRLTPYFMTVKRKARTGMAPSPLFWHSSHTLTLSHTLSLALSLVYLVVSKVMSMAQKPW